MDNIITINTKGDGMSSTSSYGNVFEMHDSKLFCKVCLHNVTNPDPQMHIESKHHKKQLRKLCVIRNDWKYYKSNLGFPKEPIFKEAFVQRKLDIFTEPLIGLEFLLEFSAFNSQLEYLCLLCHKRGHEEAIFGHLRSELHKKKYVMNYFPNAYKQIEKSGKYGCKHLKYNYKMALDDLAAAIEKHYGRLKPKHVDVQKYRSHLIYYLDIVRKGEHFYESEDFSIKHIVEKQEEALKSFQQNELAKRAENLLSKKAKRKLVREHDQLMAPKDTETSKISNESNIRDIFQLSSTSESFGNSNKEYYNKDTPHYSIAEKAENLAKYSTVSKIIDKKMEKEFIKYKENPESHPMYNEEWEKFWKKRYADLKSIGYEDPSNYDFKPEWKLFWDKRFMELHDEKIEFKKNIWRQKFGLGQVKPVQSNNVREIVLIDDDQLSARGSSKVSASQPKNLPTMDKDSSFPSKDTSGSSSHLPPCKKDSPSRRRDSPSRYRDSPSRRRYSPSRRRDSRSPLHRRDRDSTSPVRGESRRLRKRSRSRDKSSSPKRLRENDEDINFVGVLRLLTAVEGHLGSLGPKVIDLLSQSLILEGQDAKSSETLMNVDENLVLLETTKEKLKGQLQAGLVDKPQQKAFMNIVGKVESLIRISKQRKRQTGVNPNKKLLVVPGVGLVDKEKISQEIVESLVAQGKKDITQEELDHLIQVFARKEQSKQNTADSKTRWTKPELNRPVTYDHLTTSNLTVMNANAKMKDAISIDSDDDFSFKSMVKNICRKVSDNQNELEIDKKTKDKNPNKSLLETANRDNRNYNANAKINIITGIPVSTITINEFNTRNTFDKDYDMTRGNWAENHGTNVTAQKKPLNALPSPLPSTGSPFDFTTRYQYKTNTTSNQFTASGPSGILNKSFGFSSKFSTPTNYQMPQNHDRNFLSSEVGGVSYKGGLNPFSSNKFSTERNISSSSFCIPLRGDLDMNNTGVLGGHGNFEPQMRGETNVTRGRIADFKSRNSDHRVGQYGFKQRESALVGDLSNTERSQGSGYDKSKRSRFDGRN